MDEIPGIGEKNVFDGKESNYLSVDVTAPDCSCNRQLPHYIYLIAGSAECDVCGSRILHGTVSQLR